MKKFPSILATGLIAFGLSTAQANPPPAEPVGTAMQTISPQEMERIRLILKLEASERLSHVKSLHYLEQQRAQIDAAIEAWKKAQDEVVPEEAP